MLSGTQWGFPPASEAKTSDSPPAPTEKTTCSIGPTLPLLSAARYWSRCSPRWDTGTSTANGSSPPVFSTFVHAPEPPMRCSMYATPLASSPSPSVADSSTSTGPG